MTSIADRTVLFADLRGSTALFESWGNAEATTVVTDCIQGLSEAVDAHDGRVVKTLGDGLMAVFEDPRCALRAATQLHDVLDGMVTRGRERGASASLRALRLQVAVARGEVVELDGDCFGDAVNVAARLLDHAGDNETLVTAAVLEGLPADMRLRMRSLDRLALRGRAEPVHVFVTEGRRFQSEAGVTQFGNFAATVEPEPDGLRLAWGGLYRIYANHDLPLVLGRSLQASFCVDDSRVSRSHARVDWYAGGFQLTDLSYNGTYVRFAESEVLCLRRGSCMLHGNGTIGLGASPNDADSACIQFDVLRFTETQPQVPLELK